MTKTPIFNAEGQEIGYKETIGENPVPENTFEADVKTAELLIAQMKDMLEGLSSPDVGPPTKEEGLIIATQLVEITEEALLLRKEVAKLSYSLGLRNNVMARMFESFDRIQDDPVLLQDVVKELLGAMKA